MKTKIINPIGLVERIRIILNMDDITLVIRSYNEPASRIYYTMDPHKNKLYNIELILPKKLNYTKKHKVIKELTLGCNKEYFESIGINTEEYCYESLWFINSIIHEFGHLDLLCNSGMNPLMIDLLMENFTNHLRSIKGFRKTDLADNKIYRLQYDELYANNYTLINFPKVWNIIKDEYDKYFVRDNKYNIIVSNKIKEVRIMYENVKLILDISAERDVDVLVARDMAMSENQEIKGIISNAYECVIDTYYDFVTLLRRNDRDDLLEEFCNEILPTDDDLVIGNFIKKTTDSI